MPSQPATHRTIYVLHNRVRIVHFQEHRQRKRLLAKSYHAVDTVPVSTPYPAAIKRAITVARRRFDRHPKPGLFVWPDGFEDGALVFRAGDVAVYYQEHASKTPPPSLDQPPPPSFPGRFMGWLDTRDPRRAWIRRTGRWHLHQDDQCGWIWQRYSKRNHQDPSTYRQYIFLPPAATVKDSSPTFAVFPPGMIACNRCLAIHTEIGQDTTDDTPGSQP